MDNVKEETVEEFRAKRAIQLHPANSSKWDTGDILAVMAEQRWLAYSPTSAFLFDATGWYIGKPRGRIVIASEQAKTAIAESNYAIAPLSQYGFMQKVGWRELVGDLGEKFDIYTFVQ